MHLASSLLPRMFIPSPWNVCSVMFCSLLAHGIDLYLYEERSHHRYMFIYICRYWQNWYYNHRVNFTIFIAYDIESLSFVISWIAVARSFQPPYAFCDVYLGRLGNWSMWSHNRHGLCKLCDIFSTWCYMCTYLRNFQQSVCTVRTNLDTVEGNGCRKLRSST